MSSHNLEKVDFAKHYFNKVWRSLKRSFFREWGNSTDRSDGEFSWSGADEDNVNYKERP